MKYQIVLYVAGAALAAFSARRLARQLHVRRVDVGPVSERWLTEQRRDERPQERA